MKKVFAVVAVAGLFVATSCTKDYQCCVDVAGQDVCVDYNDLDKDEADALETGCTAGGGTWSTK